ncbi:hypothetical protein CROQUDRAFT_668199 [Cronartium quercuum f. sp. fusiforme G11]|uniref:Peptidyl-tRNA hydrolase n=1 Tax=Cronartium quercuum f. sp. fusiforme G11 TaxID=708437 RepID=A0A9P6NT44_9BASI|nr:hypothetical protein CROQUDRAFT_668199 [Cronartium quercuum f. sp. fusiforme G11]
MKGSEESEAPATADELTIHLFKPRALMNILGPVINGYHAELCRSQSPPRIILLHDELDIAPLKVRLKSPHHSLKPKGHNGLRSVLSAVPACRHKFVHTIGIGIGRDPHNTSKDSSAVGKWVMSPLERAEIQACSWSEESRLSGHPIYGAVVKEVWKYVRNVTRMP